MALLLAACGFAWDDLDPRESTSADTTAGSGGDGATGGGSVVTDGAGGDGGAVGPGGSGAGAAGGQGGGAPGCMCSGAEACVQGACVETCDDCGFEAGNLGAWAPQDLNDPFYPLEVASAGVSSSSDLFGCEPTEGTKALVHGFDGDGPGTIEVGQDVTLAPVSTLTLSFDYRAGWDIFSATSQDRTFRVEVQPEGGGAPLDTERVLTAMAGTNMPDTGSQQGSVDLSAFAGQTVHLRFVWEVPEDYTGPAFFQLDAVSVQ